MKYRGIQVTIRRLGTALDEQLVAWLKSVIGGKSVFVTGYSANDLDVFPALKQAMGDGRVYWNVLDKVELQEARNRSLRLWLEGLNPPYGPVEGGIAGILAGVLQQLDLRRVGVALHSPCSANSRPLSLGGIENDTVGVALATALLLHSTEARQGEDLQRDLIKFLDRAAASRAWRSEPRKSIWYGLLKGGRDHENGKFRAGTRRYQRVYGLLGRHRQIDRESGGTLRGELECVIAYQKANALKRPSADLMEDSRRLGESLRALRELQNIEVGQGQSTDKPTRALAAYFIGDLVHAWGLLADLAFGSSPETKALYEIARLKYVSATKPSDDFVPQEAFWQMRLIEIRMLLQRGRQSDPAELNEIDGWLGHFAYLNDVMLGDAAKGTLHLLNALRESLDRRSNWKRHWVKARRLYQKRGYPSGVAKSRLYQWLLRNEEASERLRKFSGRLRELTRIREGKVRRPRG